MSRGLLLGIIVALLLPARAGANLEWTWLHSIYGVTRFGCLGSALGSIGDIDGDSCADFIVGVPHSGCTLADNLPGHVRAYSGSTGGLLYDISDGTLGDEFGRSLAGIADINGDGMDDFLIGAPGLGVGLRGSVFVCSGASGTIIRRIDGEHGGFGTAIGRTGDLDGDGTEEIVVGAPYYSPAGIIWAGAVYVISGSTGSVLTRIEGTREGERLGESLSGSGDVNKDGLSDFMAMSPDDTYGTLRMFSGLGDTAIFVIDSIRVGVGARVARVSDTDNDGSDDLIIGVPHGGTPASGFASIHSGSTGSLLGMLAGANEGDRFGEAVGAGEDVNGDATPDLVVGAPGAGSFLGGFTGRAYAYDSRTDSVLFQVDGRDDAGEFGKAVAIIGDSNGDIRGDFAVGSPSSTSSALGSALGVGSVFIFGLVNTVAARSVGQDEVIHLNGASSNVCFEIEPANAAYAVEDVIPGTIVLRRSDVKYQEIHAVMDTDNNGQLGTSACFSRGELRQLFGDIGVGTTTVPASIECNVRGGLRAVAQIELTLQVKAPGAVSVTPNPMSNDGVITLQTTRVGNLSIDLFDVSGRLAAHIFNAPSAEAGYHDIHMTRLGRSGNRLAAGVYFLKITSADGQRTGRVILLN